MRILLLSFSFCALLACTGKKNLSRATILNGEAFLLTETSPDPDYGYTEAKPIMVGGVTTDEGPLNERRFLNSLLGPEGDPVYYERTGSCCDFETENGFMGYGLLDVYEVDYEGLEEPITLYINMYDAGPLYIPVNFTARK